MNTKNVKAAIDIMKQAKSLNMVDWQIGNPHKIVCDLDSLHRCGNTACFAGYVAISDAFKQDGGKASDISGMPLLGEVFGAGAISVWLGISGETAWSLIYGDCDGDSNNYSLFYDKPFCDVKPQDVIDKLNLILAGELE